MNNLDNPNILSNEMFSIVAQISKINNGPIFGGSIALNGVGVLSRTVEDIDIFMPSHRELSCIMEILNHPVNDNDTTYDSITIIGDQVIKRYGFITKTEGIKICAFICPKSFLNYSTCYVERGNKKVLVKIQHINYAIEAKRLYSNINEKHKDDLSGIYHNLNYLFYNSDNMAPLSKIFNDVKTELINKRNE